MGNSDRCAVHSGAALEPGPGRRAAPEAWPRPARCGPQLPLTAEVTANCLKQPGQTRAAARWASRRNRDGDGAAGHLRLPSTPLCRSGGPSTVRRDVDAPHGPTFGPIALERAETWQGPSDWGCDRSPTLRVDACCNPRAKGAAHK